MTPDRLFQLATFLALMGWLCLAVAPLRRPVAVAVARWAVALLAGTYAALLFRALGGGGGGGGGGGMGVFAQMGTLSGVVALFKSPDAILVGWIHYLAFDLFTGAWIVADAPGARVPHWVVLPCLFLTLIAGPVGLLAYLIARAVQQRSAA